MTLNATWIPGPNAVAGMKVLAPDRAGLVLYLHPDAFAIQSPCVPSEVPAFLRLLREIRTGVDELSAFLEARYPQPADTARHALPEDDYGDSGAGY